MLSLNIRKLNDNQTNSLVCIYNQVRICKELEAGLTHTFYPTTKRIFASHPLVISNTNIRIRHRLTFVLSLF